MQSIDTALAALYRGAHHKLPLSHIEGQKNYLHLQYETYLWIYAIEGLLKLHSAWKCLRFSMSWVVLLPKRPNCVSLFSLCLHNSSFKGRILHKVLQSQNLRLHQDN